MQSIRKFLSKPERFNVEDETFRERFKEVFSDMLDHIVIDGAEYILEKEFSFRIHRWKSDYHMGDIICYHHAMMDMSFNDRDLLMWKILNSKVPPIKRLLEEYIVTKSYFGGLTYDVFPRTDGGAVLRFSKVLREPYTVLSETGDKTFG